MAFLFREGRRREQVGPSLLRAEQGMLPAPASYGGVVAGEKDGRYFPPAVNGGACVVRVFQQTLLKRIVLVGLLRAEDAGHQTSHDIDEDHRRQLTAGKDIIADADFVIDEV